MASDGRAARYVAIITDGNGRWAQARGVPVEVIAAATTRNARACFTRGSAG
jgi:undecaprenyl pyrophosphate synthase